MKTKNNIVERKVRYRMYKAKHGWVIAGVVIATFAVTNIGSHVHSVAAATTDPAEEQTAANTQQADKVVTKTITRTIHYVGADGTQVSPDTIQSVTLSQDAQGTWHAVGASAFAAVSAPTVPGQTADVATVAAAAPSGNDSSSEVTVHYSKTADAPTPQSTATATPNTAFAASTPTTNSSATQPAGTATKDNGSTVAETTGADVDSTATSNADTPKPATNQTAIKKTDTTATPAPKVEYKSLNADTEAISVQVDGKDVDTVTDTYDGIFNINPTGNTPRLHTVTIAATNLKKDDVLTITTPAFKTVSRADVVNGLNNSARQGQTINYTATADNSNVKFSLDVSTNSAPMQNVNQGEFTVALNNKVAKSVAVQTTYNMHPLDRLDYYQYTTEGNNATKTVSTNEKFASEFNSLYIDPIPLTDVNDYTYTIPVPDGYVLDAAESSQLENERKQASIYDFSQSAPGADVVAKLNIGAAMAAGYTNTRGIPLIYFVGKLTTDGTGTATAAAKATATLNTKYGSVAIDANKPMTVQRVDPNRQADAFQVSYQNKHEGEIFLGASGPGKVYVGPNDVNQYNVNQRGMIKISKNTTDDQSGTWTVSVPDGLSSSSVLINADAAQLDRGLDATISTVDADGNELATVGLNQLNYDNNGNIVWNPPVTGNIKKYVLKINKMVNSSFGTIGIDPNLTTDALPAMDTDYHIDVSYQDASGTTKQLDGTDLTLTQDHTIYQEDFPIDASGHTVQAGDEFQFTVNPFFDAGQQTYVNADEGVILYVRLPIHATYEQTSKFNNNTSVLTTADGTQYLKIAVPAGYSLNNAANGRATSYPIVNNIDVTMKVNSDVVVGDDPTLVPDAYGQVLIGMPNNQIDESYWNATNGKTLTPDEVAKNGDSVIAQDAETSGLNKLYVGTYNTTPVWKVSVPTTLYLTNGIKADGELEYVADDSGVATFHPDDGANTGVIRAYVYNGTDVAINDYTTLVTLPSKGDGDAGYTLQLTGGIAGPADTTIKYSTNTYDVTNGTPLTAAQISDFQDASVITDWSKIRSVLVAGKTVPAATALDVQLPVQVTGTESGKDATANATAYTYANDTAGEIIGARITQLPTQVRTQRMVTVEYVDQAGNSLMNNRTLKGDVGAKTTIAAPEIAGYKPEQATQDFTYIDSNNEVVKFIYDKTQMQVQVAYINKLTGANIKNANLTPLYGSTVDLTGDDYTKVAGYTTDNNNPKSYQVTNAQKQLVQLYFTPQQGTFTVKYQTTDASGKTVDLLPADTQTGTVGTTVTIAAKVIAGYVPRSSMTFMTFSAGSSTYVFFYDQLQLPLVIKYQSEDGTKLGDDAQTNVAAGQPYDLNALGLVHSFTGYVLTDNSKSLLTGTAAYDKDTVKLTNGTITLVYNKLAKQRAVVNYLDETAHVALGADQLSGVSGTTIAYDAQARIDSYTRQGYKLISNGFPAGAKYDADDKTAQIFVVRLEHATKDEQVTTHVQRTITYVVAGGKASAPATKVETVDFTRTDTIDQVTSKAVASGPSTPASQTFAAVDTPALTGYVPDIATVAAQTVKPDQKNIAVTVTYHALQKATITYVDKTTGTTLKTDQVTGAPGAAIDYNPQAAIQTYLDQHYDLLKSDFAADSKFDTDDASTQAFTVVLLHTTSQKTVTTPVTRTINYVVADGGVAAPASVTQTVSFTQTVITDNVTGKQIAITRPNPAALTLPAQQSPVLNGYGTDMLTVPTQTVQLGAADTTVTVTYRPAKLPDTDPQVKTEVPAGASVTPDKYYDNTDGDAQHAALVYFDDTTQKVLHTDTLTGNTGTAITFDPAAKIKQYRAAGYDLVTDGYDPAATFDADDSTTQTFTVHLLHTTSQKTVTKPVTRTIVYVIADGAVAAPAVVNQNTDFTQTVITDNVTGKQIASTQFSPATATLAAQKSPVLKGYGTATLTVPALTVSAGAANTTVTVTYRPALVPENDPQVKTEVPEAPSTTPDKYYDNTDGDAQHAAIVYFDDSTHQWLHTDNLRGNTGTAIKYDAAAGIQNYTDKGYELVSNGFQSGTTYDADDATTQTYTIHLVHGTMTSPVTSSVTRTINYVVADGGKSAPAPVVQQVDFTRTLTVDKVTGQVISSTPATPTSGDFAEVYTPNLTDYAADTIVVPTTTVHYGSTNATVTVTYRPVALGPGKQVWTKVEMPEPVSTTPTPIPDNGGTTTPDGGPTGSETGTPTSTTPEDQLPDTNGNTPTTTPETNGGDDSDIGHLPDTCGGMAGSNAKQNVAATQQTLPATGGSNPVSGRGKTQQQLPQTGDENNNALSVIGLAVATLFGLLGLGKQRRHD